MENKKRIFKEKLEKIYIPETMPNEKRIELLKPIVDYAYSIIPSLLFRYRECSERNFDAFYNDKIYAVNAQMFNDPYDCLLKYDKNYLYDTIKKGASKENIKQIRNLLKRGEPFPKDLEYLYGEELSKFIKNTIYNATDEDLDRLEYNFEINKKEFFNNIEIIFKKAEYFLRRNTFIACFSETLKSITMWSHYANSHKGFVLAYNFRNSESQCDKCYKKEICNDKLIHYIFPIIYDSVRYDGTSFVESYLGKHVGFNANINDITFYTKAALNKSPQWQYEKEWRLFLNKNNSTGLSCLDIKIKPEAIYYGNDISPINKKILSEIAKEKGLKEYQMYIDTQSNRYSMKYRRI